MRRLLKSRLDQLKIDHKLPIWERLHGLWRTLPNFNPDVTSSDPGQDLEGQALRLFTSCREGGDISEEEEEIEDATPLDVEGDTGPMDIGDGSDVDLGPDQV